MFAFSGTAPLTLTLSPEGRGDAGGGAGEGGNTLANSEPITSPLRVEVDAKRRVRGKKAQPQQVVRARTLRSKMSEAENRLWYFLRDRRMAGHKFVRQYPIGRYYADFACREAMLVIEADGGQHSAERDFVRDRAIKAAGYTILRFWNHDILNRTDPVSDLIHTSLASCVPSPLWGEGQGEGPFRQDQINE